MKTQSKPCHDRPLTSVLLCGLGTALPKARLPQAAAAASALVANPVGEPSDRQRFERIYTKAGVAFRRSVLIDGDTQAATPLAEAYPAGQAPTTRERMRIYEKHAPVLANDAAREAMHDAGIDASEVTHLVTASCTGASSPGMDTELFFALGLDNRVQRTHLGFMGCHAAINVMRVAQAYALADSHAVVLCVCVELCTLHFQYTQRPDQVVANALFGDGAGAMVIRGAVADTPGSRSRVLATASRLIPETADWMTWRVGNHGFEMTLDPRVPRAISEHLPAFVDGFLSEHGLSADQIRDVITHPGGPKIIDVVEGLYPQAQGGASVSRGILHDIGNVSSATLLFAVQRQPITGPTLLLAFGPGLTFEAALLDHENA